MNDPAIRTQNLTRWFGPVKALDGLSIEVERGRVLALLGPNGAGKSTFHRLLTGLIAPTEGHAWVFGADCRRLTPEVSPRLVAIGEGREPESWATARDLFHLQAAASPEFDREAATRLCRSRGVPLRRPYGSLSKGQKRWLLAAAVLSSGADLLLLDEPAAGLDPAARREMFDHLRDYVNGREATALVATHIISDVERVADDVAIIEHGQLLLSAPLESLREEVREVEFPPSGEFPEATEGIEVLGRRDAAESGLIYVRCPEGVDPLTRSLPTSARVRPVTLEDLYLAVTGPREIFVGEGLSR